MAYCNQNCLHILSIIVFQLAIRLSRNLFLIWLMIRTKNLLFLHLVSHKWCEVCLSLCLSFLSIIPMLKLKLCLCSHIYTYSLKTNIYTLNQLLITKWPVWLTWIIIIGCCSSSKFSNNYITWNPIKSQHKTYLMMTNWWLCDKLNSQDFQNKIIYMWKAS